ncbi:PREDICTED: tetratricopeptide repeat protein 39C-like isoform X2 [Vollenhovia emeryi]|uniref:tetratricopeptide repeat protein 39C-like isoform X2 n=1 Tax=Vollenhovia emeryi TaxID=411798 RepID=UPI0005F3C21D|nr:PREDICTED: tetratricopeptide repeat protein 39C-like isoform X2 [Vollenhovia emeryi]
MAIAEDAGKDWKVARTGISLLLNNRTEEAEALFTEHPHSFHVKAGRCFVLFMNALMTFEEDKFQQATLLLKDMERECAGDIGWLKSVRSKVFRAEETDKDYVNKLERQIVLADTQVFSAVSLFLQQELTGYVRGCWMLRKAWRVYQHAYTQISQLYRRTFGTNPTGFSPCVTPASNGSSLQSPQSPESSEWSIPSCNGYVNNVTPAPSPSGLRSSLSMLFSLTGITSEQQTPLSLLWYHTIVRPFFALDGSNVKAGVAAAKQLIAECHAEFQDSALFLFFAGRMERLETNVDGALEAFGKAVDVATQREVKLLCLHEVAWCHVIRLNYDEAYRSLLQLQQQSRWSKGFYAYLAMVCCGANGKFDVLLSLHGKILPWFHETKSESQLDVFIMRRMPKIVDKETGHPYTALYYKLLVYESLYLWNALPSCSAESLRGISYECKENHSEEPMVGLIDLIEGAACLYLGDTEAAIKSFRNCLKHRYPSKDEYDQHISAFALYELGSSLSNNNNPNEGKSFLLKAQNQYKDYDFETRLNLRIHAALKNI